MACALGVGVTMAEAGVGCRGDGLRDDLLRLSTPILRRLIERGSADIASRFEPTAASGAQVKIAPVRRKGMGCGRGAGNEKEKMKVLV